MLTPITYTAAYYSYTGSPGNVTSQSASFNLYSELVPSYIGELPDPILDTTVLTYRLTLPGVLASKCFGDVDKPSYRITISVAEKGFEDWPYATVNGSTASLTQRCFSLK